MTSISQTFKTLALGAAATVLTTTQAVAADDGTAVRYRYQSVDGVEIFYREAGRPTAPTVLLLHGFPTSSHMYRDLIPRLASKYHVIAPDYPGYGYSAAPSPEKFTYTFDHLASLMERFTEEVGLQHYTLYLQDFGGPVGFRMATAHPDRVDALVIQNANAYEEGLSPAMDAARPAWVARTPETEKTLRGFLTLETTRFQFLNGAEAPDRINPDSWMHAQAGLDRPGNAEIQLALLHDYGSNPKLYQEWQRYFRTQRPPTLIVWGRGDPFFTEAGAKAYQRDLPNAELHLLDAGHFALEDHVDLIAALMVEFLDKLPTKR